MEENRMLSDEILLALIKKNGGGGGGTDDYNDLKNQPKINNNTLVGNKTASDLGLADSDTVNGILNGTDIDSFGAVETALSDKQNALTAGDYISIDAQNSISVNRDLVPHQTSYRIKGTGTYTMNITKYIDGVEDSSTDYGYSQGTTRTIDDAFTINDTYSSSDGYIWQFVWLRDSTTHDKDYTVSYRAYNAAFDFTEVFNDEDLSGYKLVIKSELDAALAGKQDKTDNSLQTTDKTVVGAINEHEGDIDSLKSGLTNLDTEVNGDATVYPYADVITIEDAVPANLADCSVKIEPVQDLHGYDKPWVGGAGKNLFTGSDNTYTNDTAQTNVFAPTAVSKELTGAYYISFDYKVLESSTNNQALFYAMSNGSAVSGGNIFNFIDGNVSTNWIHMSGIMNRSVTFDAIYMFSNNKMTVKNVMVSATEGDFEPYANICPISGHTQASVQRDGKNLCFRGEGNIYNGGGLIPVDVGNKIYCYGKWTSSSTTNMYGAVFDTANQSDKNTGRLQKFSNFQSGNISVCTVSQKGYFGVCFNSAASDYEVQEMMISRTPITSATDYEPFRGKTYTIALGDTIYGGTVDFDSGVMTVTHKYVEFSGGETETWTSASDRPHSFSHAENLGIVDAWSRTDITMISNQFIQNGEVAYYGSNYRIGYTNSGTLYVGMPNIDNVADFKTYLSNNHLQIVGTLATPFTVQLTPQQIQLLKGTNTLTASTGQISVTANGVSGSIGAVQEQVNAIKPVDYSTTEQKTGQKWIDGKDIYVKTIECGVLPNNTTKEVSHGISSIDSMVKIEGVATNTSGGVSLNLPLVYESSNANLNTRVSIDDTKIYICTNADRSSYDASYVTLYYTKTT